MRRLAERLLRNWPLKLAALTLAAILWIVVAAEETHSDLARVELVVELPPPLALARQAPPVRALVTGPARELVKLAAAPMQARVLVPPSAVPPLHRVRLSPSDITIPNDARISIQDFEPRELDLEIDRFVRRPVPVSLRGTIEAESGFVIVGQPVVTPRTVVVSGARSVVYAVDSIPTEPFEVRGVTAPFERVIPLDTARPLVTIAPREITISGRVRRQ
ncbi:MAG TPA: YbbR-like domain-containing protein [Gemmatimonadales bacterium]|nr:YbbR-like domain-containing protein [Gemmatimonadales bacterium]